MCGGPPGDASTCGSGRHVDIDGILDAVAAIQGHGGEPDTVLANPADITAIRKLKSTQGVYLLAPDAVVRVRHRATVRDTSVMEIPRRFQSEPDAVGTGPASPDRFPCPCCGFLVFEEPPGSYDICPICGWEDDLSQLRFPRSTGANRVSLIEAQAQFAAAGADGPQSDVARAAALSTPREPGWRRLDEAADNIEESTRGVDYGLSYPEDSTTLYYWRRTFWRPPPDS